MTLWYCVITITKYLTQWLIFQVFLNDDIEHLQVSCTGPINVLLCKCVTSVALGDRLYLCNTDAFDLDVCLQLVLTWQCCVEHVNRQLHCPGLHCCHLSHVKTINTLYRSYWSDKLQPINWVYHFQQLYTNGATKVAFQPLNLCQTFVTSLCRVWTSWMSSNVDWMLYISIDYESIAKLIQLTWQN